jgi:putative peptidoglycan lipid II flippase
MSKKLLRSTLTVGGMTFVSRILGFLRDMIVAHTFGAGPVVDAFLVAFKIPNFMRRLFAEGAFSQAFIPILSEYKATRTHAEIQLLVNRVSGSLASILGVITCLGMIGAPYVISVFAPGFKEAADGRFTLASDMLRLVFPYLLLVSLTAFCSGVLNTYGRFAISSFTPTLLNVALILAALMSSWVNPPIFSLAYGVLLGGVLQLVFQLPHLKRINLLPKPAWGWQDPGVRRIILLMGPAIVGASVMQINLMVDTIFASFLPAGSVTWLYYSERMLEFPLGTFGVALSTVILPHLSKRHAEQNTQYFSASIDWALKWVLLIGLPASVGLTALSFPVMMSLFQYGAFGAEDALMASQSLMAMSSGLTLFIGIKVLVSAFYAQQNTKTPVKIAIAAMLANVVLNALLVVPLKHTGLALASTLSAGLNGGLLLWFLIKQKRYQPTVNWALILSKVLLASSLMFVFLIKLMPMQSLWIEAASLQRVMWLFGLIFGAAGVYLLTLWCLGLRGKHLAISQTS